MKTSKVTDLDLMYYFLGIKIDQNEVFISQKKYAKNLLKKFKINYCKAVATPLVTNGKATKTRWDRKS